MTKKKYIFISMSRTEVRWSCSVLTPTCVMSNINGQPQCSSAEDDLPIPCLLLWSRKRGTHSIHNVHYFYLATYSSNVIAPLYNS